VTGGFAPVTFLLQVFWWILILHVIFSWIPRPPEPIVPFVLGVRRMVEPVVAPIRRVIPPLRLGGIALDLSIIVVLIGVRILMSITASIGL
jgi:YggT family protein